MGGWSWLLEGKDFRYSTTPPYWVDFDKVVMVGTPNLPDLVDEYAALEVQGVNWPPLQVVAPEPFIVLNGHHRYEAMRRTGRQRVLIWEVNLVRL